LEEVRHRGGRRPASGRVQARFTRAKKNRTNASAPAGECSRAATGKSTGNGNAVPVGETLGPLLDGLAEVVTTGLDVAVTDVPVP